MEGRDHDHVCPFINYLYICYTVMMTQGLYFDIFFIFVIMGLTLGTLIGFLDCVLRINEQSLNCICSGHWING